MSSIIQKTGRPVLICQEITPDLRKNMIEYLKGTVQLLEEYEDEEEQESQDT